MATMPPLLMLAEGRKPRPRRAPAWRPEESKLHCDVAQLLNDHCLPDWRWRHISAKAKDAREGAILKKMGVKPGWPDFLILSPFSDRQLHGLELKRIGEDLTDEQEEWRDWAFRYGGKYAVARTIDEVLAAFDTWGCLRIVPTRREMPVVGGVA